MRLRFLILLAHAAAEMSPLLHFLPSSDAYLTTRGDRAESGRGGLA